MGRRPEGFRTFFVAHPATSSCLGSAPLPVASTGCFLLKLPHLSRLVQFHPDILLLPAIKSLLADPYFPDQLRHRNPSLGLFHRRHYLLYRKSLLLHSKS